MLLEHHDFKLPDCEFTLKQQIKALSNQDRISHRKKWNVKHFLVKCRGTIPLLETAQCDLHLSYRIETDNVLV